MGVHNLWELLAPVGRRVSVEALAGKKLAIDASIWMIQFMKAMRDEKGEMVRNAHILGFFRRICKLLFLRTKPVFVFDGATPALKRRTVIARRRQRENAQTKIRKTAEKLLLNHLKAMRLKELAKDLENQRQKNDAKGKRKITDKTDIAGTTPEGTETVPGSYNQEAIDEMLAASLAAEENESLMHHASTSAACVPSEEEDNEEDEEMILPMMHGKVDPAVLAALPPSMQLDLLVQMRERLMAENRQKYQKVKKAPERFSELQIQAYLKTVAFRRDIDEVRKSAVGRGIGGVQTSRIASEANREFIFSSSFTGDKQVLTSIGLEKNSSEQRQIPTAPPSNTSDGPVSTKKSNASGTVVDESQNVINNDVETYLDERGRVRVSRVRAMGFRMTRDLQRNLDLMKEIEKERLGTATNTSNNPLLDENTVGVSRKLPSKIQLLETSDQGTDEPVCSNRRNEEFVNRYGTSIEVSFEDNGEHINAESDDDLFTHLVAGDSDMVFSADNNPLKKQSPGSVSDCEWEEGVMEDNIYNNTLNHDVEFAIKPSLAEGHERHESELEWEEGSVDIHAHASSCLSEYKETVTTGDNNESEVEWEDGSSDIPGFASSCPPEFKEVVSKGAFEEEVNFQEAIRISLEDLRCHKNVDASSEDERLNRQEIDNEGTCVGTIRDTKDLVEPKVSPENVLQPNESSSEVLGGAQRVDGVSGLGFLRIDISPSIQLAPSIEVKPDNMEVLVAREGDSYQNIHSELGKNSSASGKLCGEIGHEESVTPTEEKGVDLVEKQIMYTSSRVGQVPTTNYSPGISSHISDSLSVVMHDVTLDDARQFEFKTLAKDHLKETAEPIEPLVKDSIDNYAVQRLIERENDILVKEKEDFIKNSALREATKEQVEITEASLEEEMQNLDKERTTLGDEQRKLERNAESVSSEMFAECQELLQMFGLPYIIAPMEAEAQCAYMEIENFVDGVVTDDSDVFLFGARSVYKNIFDDRKYVETYFMKDIENELGLTREKLIRMALLLGSDYTEGVSGIGIVNAIEVINAFPEEDGLRKFREWIESPDPAILGKVDLQAGSSSRKRGSKVGDSSMNSSNSDVEGGVSASDQHAFVTDLHKMKQKFMDKHRNVSKNWHIPSSFPSEAVISAYDSPQVDKATETFSWGKPDLFVLRKLCWEKFGWGTQKADELLLPVLKEYNKHETQLRLEAFYTFNERFAKIRSKRIKKVVKGTMGNKSSNLMDDTVQDVSKSRKKRKVSSSEAGSGVHDSRSDHDVARDDTNSTEEPATKQSRKRRIHGEPYPSEGGNSEPSIQAVGRKNTKRGSSVRGRGRGRGRGRSAGRGRRKESSGLEYAEISTNDGNDSETEQEVPVENYEGSHVVRRSTRPRKAVKYTMNDLDIEESGKANQDSGGSADEAGENEILEDAGIVGVGAAAASPSKRNHHKVGDPLLVESLSKDYIEMEGGICMDEAEPNTGTGQVSLDQTGDPLLDAELSQEYLRMGGGFCLDEDEVDKNSGKSAYSPAKDILSENDNPSHCSGFGEETEHDVGYEASELVSNPIRAAGELQVGGHTDASYVMQNVGIPDVTNTIHDNHSNLAISHENIEGDDSGAKSAGFLSAMPNLRRKRRS